MREPALRDGAFLADVAAAAGAAGRSPASSPQIRAGTDPADRFCLWWLGQSGFLLQWRGRH